MLLEKKYFCFTFQGKNNNKITTRCLSNFKGPIVSYLSAALSCEQTSFFLVTLVFSETLLSEDGSEVESRKPAKSRASQETNPIGIGEKG